MKQGKSRFEFHLNKVEALLAESATQENPAEWLFANDLRTPMFMLEGLAKLYAGCHNEKLFSKLKEHFKAVEDVLGGIDYYAAFAKSLAADTAIPTNIVQFLEQNAQKQTQALAALLKNENWLNGKRIQKIREKLEAVDWKKPEKEIGLFRAVFQKEIKSIHAFVEERNFAFDNVEEDVHELRRKLRWLCIYPHALQGAVQLAPTTNPSDQTLEKYLTPQTLASKFNKMPAAGDNTVLLMLDQNYFYALSWLVASLGRIKDDGLKIEVLHHAFQNTTSLPETEALQTAYQVLGEAYPRKEQLLTEASSIAKQYFDEGNLEKLKSNPS